MGRCDLTCKQTNLLFQQIINIYIYVHTMTTHSSNTIDINITNVDKDLFDYILRDLTTMIVNLHFKKNFTTTNIYNFIVFKDNNKTNLTINNIVVLEKN